MCVVATASRGFILIDDKWCRKGKHRIHMNAGPEIVVQSEGVPESRNQNNKNIRLREDLREER